GRAWWIEHHGAKATYKTRGYSGKERDATGLYYYGYRYYAPWQQRWINPDPAGEVDGLNLYCFVSNSPVRYIDRDGRMREGDLPPLDPNELAAIFQSLEQGGAMGDQGALEVGEGVSEGIHPGNGQVSGGTTDQSLDAFLQTLGGSTPNTSAQERALVEELSKDLEPSVSTRAIPVVVLRAGEIPTTTDAIVVSYGLAPATSGDASENVRNEPQPSTSAAASSSGAEQPNTGRKRFVCPTCDKRLTSNSGLKRHLRIHTGDQPFVCAVCNKSFTQRGNLSTHELTHSNETPYSCGVCGSRFRSPRPLKYHTIKNHSTEKLCTCDVCGAVFAQESCLTRHKKIHTLDRPFKCETCPSSFRSTQVLARHRNSTHR
ncbi:RHS repeat-associated core domain protein containing protein, partial [Pseudomonas sp. GM33]